MAQDYTRQSSFADGDTINASLFNNEYDQIVNAFSYSSSSVSSTGHRHDGTDGQGGNIFKIGDLDFLNKIEVDGTNNRLGFYVEVSSVAVEQIRIQDGGIVPVTTNDIDLGTASLQFKDIYIDGTANLDSLVLGSGSTVTSILDEDGLTSDSATALATQQSIKAYVDAQVTAQDFDFSADTGGALSIDLDSEAMTFTGGTGIDTSGSGNAVTFAIDSTVATLTGTQTLSNKTLSTPVVSGNLTTDGLIDGRDVATDGTKLDGIESGATADQTAAEIKTAYESNADTNAFTDADESKLDGIESGATADQTATEIKTAYESNADTNAFTDADHTKLDGIEANATADQTAAEIRTLVEAATDSNVFTDADHTKLNGIEAGADVTDTANVTAAGALMDSEVTNLAQVKAFDSSDYATAAQGTTADAALPRTGGAMTGAITTNSTFDGRDVATDGTKLDGIEALADVTDTANVTAAGALMDSELTNITAVKALNQGVATTDSPTFAGLTTTADIAFGNNDKAIFGTGNDLLIFHDGSNNFFSSELGDLVLQAKEDDSDVAILSDNGSGGTADYFRADGSTGASILYNYGNQKLATTSTGIDVTGTVTAGGQSVGTQSIVTTNPTSAVGFPDGHVFYVV